MDTVEQRALRQAVELVGGQTDLARKLTELFDSPEKKIKQAHVWNWLNRDKRTPAEYAIPIERIVNGQITRHELRPDLYPKENAA